MRANISAFFSGLSGRFQGRVELEVEVIALRHQLAVLRRQRPGRPRLSSIDRHLWVWLYRVSPRCLGVMVLVKPAAVVQWQQATLAKYMMRRAGTPSPTWRSFLRNEVIGIAAIDMFVVPSATFRLMFGSIRRECLDYLVIFNERHLRRVLSF